MSNAQTYDVIIVGGGIGGVVSLKYAKSAGVNALLLERSSGIGGIWRNLPPWQDIQFRREDWTLGDVPISGEDQASIVANIEAWVDRFNLRSAIRLNSNVTLARCTADGWEITAGDEIYRARFLVAATGGHNRPVIPQPERISSTVREFHSSQLRDPGELSGRDVIVVGGGASAYDLLDLCFEHRARQVVWVYRNLKWMRPTQQVKYFAADVRLYGRQQMLGLPMEKMNRLVNVDLRARYERAGIREIMPDYDFDFRRHQFIPGRRGMIKNFSRIKRHRAEISRIEKGTAYLSNGQCVDADHILWGTGYELDLSYFGVAGLSRLRRLQELTPRCGSLFRSLDAPNLFFLAPGVLETSTSTPWAYAHAAKSIISQICGNTVFDTRPVTDNVNYFDLVRFLARRDRSNYFPVLWYLKYLYTSLRQPKALPMPLP